MSKIKYLLFALLLSPLQPVYAQNDISWSVSSGGALADHGNSIAVDPDGNAFITGSFQGEASFENIKKNSAGDTDAFLAKYNKSGKLLWASSIGSNLVTKKNISEYGTDILYSDNHVYVTGVFIGTAQVSDTRIKSNGKHDIFLLKYTSEGKLVWARTVGSITQDIPYSLASDVAGNLYITGTLQKTISIDAQSLKSSNGSYSSFLAKFTPNGDLAWVKDYNSQIAKAVKCIDGYCLVATISDDTQTKIKKNLISRFLPDGTLAWTIEMSNHSNRELTDFLLLNNNLYVTSVGTNPFNDSGLNDYSLIEKIDLENNTIWLKNFDGVTLHNICVSNDYQQIILSGDFTRNFTLDEDTVMNSGASDIFIGSFSKEGTLNWAQTYGGDGQDLINKIVPWNNSLYWVGFFRSSVNVEGHYLMSRGKSDIIISKTHLLPARAFTTENESTVSIYPNPAKEYFTIDSKIKINSITITTTQGVEVFKAALNAKKTVIDTKYLSKGNYIVKLTFNHGFINSKLQIL